MFDPVFECYHFPYQCILDVVGLVCELLSHLAPKSGRASTEIAEEREEGAHPNVLGTVCPRHKAHTGRHFDWCADDLRSIPPKPDRNGDMRMTNESLKSIRLCRNEA